MCQSALAQRLDERQARLEVQLVGCSLDTADGDSVLLRPCPCPSP